MSETLTPATENDVSDAIRSALADHAPLEIRGGESRLGLGRPVEAARRLSTSGLGGIRLYEPGALCLVAGAGTPLRMIEETLGGENQRLAFEPMDHRPLLGTGDAEPTIGGVVACGVSGPRRIQAGACRDSLIGVRFVNGKGDIVKNGGRVMKNVTGYDLVKLMCGTYGTLGVLTEVSFKLLPRPEDEATVVIEGLDDSTAIRALSAGLGSPFDLTGAAHLPAGLDDAPARTLVRVEGFKASVAYRAERLAELFAPFAPARSIGADDSGSLWRSIRDCGFFAGKAGAVWRVSVKPSDGPAVVAALRKTIEALAYYDWGGGLVWLSVSEDGDAGAAAIRAETAKFGGHATLVRARETTRSQVPVFEPEPRTIAALTNGIKSRFDPAGLLNPGRMRA